MSTIIHSNLLKAHYLIGNSVIFPDLVRAASAYEGVSYSEAVLHFCATRPAILGALEMTDETALDDNLHAFARNPDTAGTLDTLILTAVAEYKQVVAEYKQKEEEPNGNN